MLKKFYIGEFIFLAIILIAGVEGYNHILYNHPVDNWTIVYLILLFTIKGEIK